MANSTSGAVKALIEGAGLGLSAYDETVHKDKAYPYVLIREGLAVVPEPAFNQNDDSQGHVRETVGVDLWQRWKDPVTGQRSASYTLADALAKIFRGARLTTAPYHVSGVRLVNGPTRIADPDANLLHHAYTVEIHRVLARN